MGFVYPAVGIPVVRLADKLPEIGVNRVPLVKSSNGQDGVLDLRLTEKLLFAPLDKNRAENHPLRDFILKPTPLSSEDFRNLSSFLEEKEELQIMISEAGAQPAASGPTTHYRGSSWPRDAALSIIAHVRAGRIDEAKSVLCSWVLLYGSEPHRGRFYDLATSSDRTEAFKNPERTPISVATIGDNGCLDPNRIIWGHNQMESSAWIGWAAYRLANRKIIDLRSDLDNRLTLNDLERGSESNQKESLFPLMAKALIGSEFWNQSDLGMWEFKLRHQRASSIGICIGFLKELYRYHSSRPDGWCELPVCYDESWSREGNAKHFKSEVELAIREGEKVLQDRIPTTPGDFATECDHPIEHQDSALIFLAYPLDLDLEPNQIRRILGTLQKNIRLEGIIRYPGDEYVGRSYPFVKDENIQQDFAHPNQRDLEARWSPFDPTISAFLFRLSEENLDWGAHVAGDLFFRRAILQINPHEVSYTFARERGEYGLSREVTVPQFAFSEARFRHRDSWLPNHNFTLAWTVAMLTCGLQRGFTSALQWEDHHLRRFSSA